MTTGGLVVYKCVQKKEDKVDEHGSVMSLLLITKHKFGQKGYRSLLCQCRRQEIMTPKWCHWMDCAVVSRLGTKRKDNRLELKGNKAVSFWRLKLFLGV